MKVMILNLITLLFGITSAFSQVLTHGPVVGAVTANSAKVFLRTDKAATVILHYGTDPTLQIYIESAPDRTRRASDFTDIIAIAGLSPQTVYYADVLVNGVSQFASSFPFFTTFPADDAAVDTTFAVLTDFCKISTLNATFPTFQHAAMETPAFCFIGGDFDHSDPQTLKAARKMYKLLYGENVYMVDFRDFILRRMAVMHQWDDHDSGINNDDKTNPFWPQNQQVFNEYMPSYPLPATSPGIWQTFRYGSLLQGFILDCRSHRDPDATQDGPNKSMLGAEQLAWLEQGLLTSTARWKIIFSSVIMNTTTKLPDGWAAFIFERTALLNFISSNNIKNVVVISGDLHLGAIDSGTHSGLPEMCVAGPNHENIQNNCATARLPGQWNIGYYDDQCDGYGLCKITTNYLNFTTKDLDGVTRVTYTVPSSDTPP